MGRLDSLRAASTSKTNEDLRLAMESMLQKFRSEHVITLQDGDEVEVVDAPGRGLDATEKFVRYWNEEIARLLNGSVRPAGHSAQGIGAKAQAKVEEDSSEAYYQDDREDLDNILTDQLVNSFLYHNFANLVKLGLVIGETCKAPVFTSNQIKRQDPQVSIDVMTKSVQAGAPITVNEWYESINYTPPALEEEVISQDMLPEMQQMEMTNTLEQDRHNLETEKQSQAVKDNEADRKERKESAKTDNGKMGYFRAFTGRRKPEWNNL
jgi:hypothetical protein